MDSAIYKLKQFVSDANNSVMQYNNHTIKKLNRLGPKAGVHIIYLGKDLSDSQKNGLDNTYSYTIEERDLRLADKTISVFLEKTLTIYKEKYNPNESLEFLKFIPQNYKMRESEKMEKDRTN